ncbi:hypothetical protein ACTXT7_007160 [Hymenolepis weldensis]
MTIELTETSVRALQPLESGDTNAEVLVAKTSCKTDYNKNDGAKPISVSIRSITVMDPLRGFKTSQKIH